MLGDKKLKVAFEHVERAAVRQAFSECRPFGLHADTVGAVCQHILPERAPGAPWPPGGGHAEPGFVQKPGRVGLDRETHPEGAASKLQLRGHEAEASHAGWPEGRPLACR